MAGVRWAALVLLTAAGPMDQLRRLEQDQNKVGGSINRVAKKWQTNAMNAIRARYEKLWGEQSGLQKKLDKFAKQVSRTRKRTQKDFIRMKSSFGKMRMAKQDAETTIYNRHDDVVAAVEDATAASEDEVDSLSGDALTNGEEVLDVGWNTVHGATNETAEIEKEIASEAKEIHDEFRATNEELKADWYEQWGERAGIQRTADKSANQTAAIVARLDEDRSKVADTLSRSLSRVNTTAGQRQFMIMKGVNKELQGALKATGKNIRDESKTGARMIAAYAKNADNAGARLLNESKTTKKAVTADLNAFAKEQHQQIGQVAAELGSLGRTLVKLESTSQRQREEQETFAAHANSKVAAAGAAAEQLVDQARERAYQTLRELQGRHKEEVEAGSAALEEKGQGYINEYLQQSQAATAALKVEIAEAAHVRQQALDAAVSSGNDASGRLERLQNELHRLRGSLVSVRGKLRELPKAQRRELLARMREEKGELRVGVEHMSDDASELEGTLGPVAEKVLEDASRTKDDALAAAKESVALVKLLGGRTLRKLDAFVPPSADAARALALAAAKRARGVRDLVRPLVADAKERDQKASARVEATQQTLAAEQNELAATMKRDTMSIWKTVNSDARKLNQNHLRALSRQDRAARRLATKWYRKLESLGPKAQALTNQVELMVQGAADMEADVRAQIAAARRKAKAAVKAFHNQVKGEAKSAAKLAKGLVRETKAAKNEAKLATVAAFKPFAGEFKQTLSAQVAAMGDRMSADEAMGRDKVEAFYERANGDVRAVEKEVAHLADQQAAVQPKIDGLKQRWGLDYEQLQSRAASAAAQLSAESKLDQSSAEKLQDQATGRASELEAEVRSEARASADMLAAASRLAEEKAGDEVASFARSSPGRSAARDAEAVARGVRQELTKAEQGEAGLQNEWEHTSEDWDRNSAGLVMAAAKAGSGVAADGTAAQVAERDAAAAENEALGGSVDGAMDAKRLLQEVAKASADAVAGEASDAKLGAAQAQAELDAGMREEAGAVAALGSMGGSLDQEAYRVAGASAAAVREAQRDAEAVAGKAAAAEAERTSELARAQAGSRLTLEELFGDSLAKAKSSAQTLDSLASGLVVAKRNATLNLRKVEAAEVHGAAAAYKALQLTSEHDPEQLRALKHQVVVAHEKAKGVSDWMNSYRSSESNFNSRLKKKLESMGAEINEEVFNAHNALLKERSVLEHNVSGLDQLFKQKLATARANASEEMSRTLDREDGELRSVLGEDRRVAGMAAADAEDVKRRSDQVEQGLLGGEENMRAAAGALHRELQNFTADVDRAEAKVKFINHLLKIQPAGNGVVARLRSLQDKFPELFASALEIGPADDASDLPAAARAGQLSPADAKLYASDSALEGTLDRLERLLRAQGRVV